MIVVAGLLVNRLGECLMGLRRRGKLRPCMWEYPGGKVEAGEAPIDALRREWREELGVEAHAVTLVAAVELNVEVPMRMTLYRVRVVGEPRLLDHDEIRWVDPLAAVQHLPCTPTTYLVYQSVADVAAAVRSGEVA